MLWDYETSNCNKNSKTSTDSVVMNTTKDGCDLITSVRQFSLH